MPPVVPKVLERPPEKPAKPRQAKAQKQPVEQAKLPADDDLARLMKSIVAAWPALSPKRRLALQSIILSMFD